MRFVLKGRAHIANKVLLVTATRPQSYLVGNHCYIVVLVRTYPLVLLTRLYSFYAQKTHGHTAFKEQKRQET